MTITALPAAPSRADDPGTFSSKADALLGALPNFVTEANGIVAGANAAASSAAQSASVAAGAVSAIGVTAWISGAEHSIGDCRFSPANFQTYRRKTVGGGTTDPGSDPTNWAALVSGEVTLAGNETLSNKRISAHYYIDRTYTNASVTGETPVDVSLASVFNLTLTGAATLSVSNAPTLSGETQSFVVRITQSATAYALTWFSGITWLTVGGTPPAAPAANKTIEYIFTTTAAGAYQGRKGAAT